MGMPGIADAVERVHRSSETTLARQIALSRVPAPTGDETARAHLLQRMLDDCGFAGVEGAHVSQDGTGNVIARLTPPGIAAANQRAAIVCIAHLDTVFPAETPLATRREGDVVMCPGIGDNGRGLAAMLALAEQCTMPDVRAGLRRPIEFVATVGEEGEGNLRGARAYFDARDEHEITSVLVLDGPGDSTIVHHAVASTRLRVTYTGPGGHSWIDRKAPNPIHALGGAIAAISRLSSSQSVDASVTVTRTSGGESVTSIAERAWFDVDLRALDGTVLQRNTASVRSLATQYAAGCACAITIIGERPGGSLNSEHPLVALAARMTRWCGAQPVSAMASTDANIPLARGIPAITIGAGGRGGGAHSAGEWFDNDRASHGIVRALGIVASLATDRVTL